MSWVAGQPGSTLLELYNLPPKLRQVVSFVESSPAVVEGSVKCYKTTFSDCKYAVSFQLQWDTPARILEPRLQAPELLALWFTTDLVPDLAPEVRADRQDFPVDLPHSNPIEDGEPAHLCLAREPLHAIYARRGIRGVLERTNAWLSDAAAGRLDHDGWEPTPRWRDFCNATLDISAFQQFSLRTKKDKSGVTQGFALTIIDEGADKNLELQYRLVAEERQMDHLWDKVHMDTLPTKSRTIGVARWFCLWGPRNKSTATRFWKSVRDLNSLLRYADVAGCKALAENVVLHNLRYANAGGHMSFLILIGTWRPKPLVKSIPGLAQGPAASLELAGFYVWMKKDERHGYQVDFVREARLLAQADYRNLNRFAGYTTLPGNTVIVGLGALGSKIAEHVLREGAPTLKLVDYDKFNPHNLARHTLAADSVFFPKVTELQAQLNAINPHCKIEPFRRNFASIPVGALKKELIGDAKGALIDATADIQVMRRLCNKDCVMRVAKVELAHGGLLGLLYYEGRGRKPRVDELKAVIPTLGQHVPEISAWLNGDDKFSMDTGIGCASASMQMADSRVSLHAANFMASLGKFIRLEDHPPGIGIGILDENGHFNGWKWITEEPFQVHSVKDGAATWDVRVRKSVSSKIDEHRQNAAAIETGGYLYGTYDLTLRTIYVTAAAAVVSEASPARVRLPGAGTSPEELELRKFSGDQMTLLGTWHTHPGGAARPSFVDIEQFKKDAAACSQMPVPHIMLIQADTGVSVSLAVPEAWGDE